MSQGGVDAVERALRILECFTSERPSCSLAELARETGFHKSTILRLIHSLEHFNYIERDAAGRYHVGPAPWRLGAIYRQGFHLGDAVCPVLRELLELTGETVAFYVRRGDHRVCLYRENSRRAARHHVEVGEALLLDKGSGGHVLQAFDGARGPLYEQIRRDGYAVSLGERDPDVAGVAAPVFGPDGNLVGALLISGLRWRFTQSRVSELVEHVVRGARDVGHRLGSARPGIAEEGVRHERGGGRRLRGCSGGGGSLVADADHRYASQRDPICRLRGRGADGPYQLPGDDLADVAR